MPRPNLTWSEVTDAIALDRFTFVASSEDEADFIESLIEENI